MVRTRNMKYLKYILILPLILSAHSAFAAIAFDATSQYLAASSETSVSWSHTVTGSNPYLSVSCYINQGSNDTTSATYNGVAMTKIHDFTTSTRRVWTYGLMGPATGANTLVMNVNSVSEITCQAISYAGVSQTGQPEASTTNTTASSNSFTTSLTTISDNAWIIGYDRASLLPSAGTGVTARDNTTIYNTIIGDSGADITPAGSYDMTFTSAVATLHAVSMVAIAPVAVAAPTIFQTILSFFDWF